MLRSVDVRLPRLSVYSSNQGHNQDSLNGQNKPVLLSEDKPFNIFSSSHQDVRVPLETNKDMPAAETGFPREQGNVSISESVSDNPEMTDQLDLEFRGKRETRNRVPIRYLLPYINLTGVHIHILLKWIHIHILSLKLFSLERVKIKLRLKDIKLFF